MIGFAVKPHRMVAFDQAVELAHRLASSTGVRRKVIRDGRTWLVVEAGA